jgi:hypothetical protein
MTCTVITQIIVNNADETFTFTGERKNKLSKTERDLMIKALYWEFRKKGDMLLQDIHAKIDAILREQFAIYLSLYTIQQICNDKEKRNTNTN